MVVISFKTRDSRFQKNSWSYWPVILVLIGLLIHWGSLSLPILSNELGSLTTNPAHLNLEAFFSRFFSLKGLVERPLSTFTYAFTFQLFGSTAFPFFAANLLIHLLNGVLLYYLGRQLGMRFSWLVALIFLAHPLSSAVVSEVFGRPYSLGTFFSLMALLLFEKAKAGEVSDLKASLGCIALIFLATLSKQTFVILPVIFYWRLFSHRAPIRLVIEKKWIYGAFFLLGAAFIWFYAWPRSMTAGQEVGRPITALSFFCSQLGNAVSLLGFYVFPAKLSLYTPLPFYDSLRQTSVWMSGLGLLVLLYSIFRSRARPIGFFLGGLLIALIPTNSFFPKEQVVLPWRLYFSTIFFALSIGWLVERAYEATLELKDLRRTVSGALAALIFIYACFFGFIVIRQNRTYADQLTAYQQIVRFYPDRSTGYLWLCRHWLSVDNHEKALEAARDAVRADPAYPRAQLNLRYLEREFQVTKSFFSSSYEGSPDELSPNSFGQAENFLADFNGQPLLSANWKGKFRPYLFADGQFQPLFQVGSTEAFENFDFFKPTPISAHEIRLDGRNFGNKISAQFLYDTKSGQLRLLNESSDAEGPSSAEQKLKSPTPPSELPFLFRTKQIGADYFAIAASSTASKSLAVLKQGKWEIQTPPHFRADGVLSQPQEIWLLAMDGSMTQAIYFGAERPEKVVLWLHDGPKEVVLPHFNPYFQELNRRGYGVLALNYPGSTGRGPKYEQEFSNEASQAKFFDSVFRFLSENSVNEVVSWSVGASSELQKFLLKKGYSISGLIDQAGGHSAELRALAIEKGVPYFSIRGTSDLDPTDASFVDFLYYGGRDIVFYPDFKALFERAGPYLQSLPRWKSKSRAPTRPDFILDPGHTGSQGDQNRVKSLRESDLTFELARHILRLCTEGKTFALTRSGQPTWEPPDTTLTRRGHFLRDLSTVPALRLHFNVSTEGFKSRNLSSTFVPWKYEEDDKRFARSLIESMKTLDLQPKLAYPEFTRIRLKALEPGVFARDMHQHQRREAPTVLLEAAYYDDEDEYKRLSNIQLLEDGTSVRPRLIEMASAICTALK